MDAANTNARIREIAKQQHGLLTTAQCRQAAIGSRAIGRRVKSGMLDRVSPLVLRLHGTAETTESRLMAAVLDAGPGAVLSHDTAAAVWGLPGFLGEPVHVIAERRRVHRTSAYLATVHEPRLLLDHHTTEIDRLPVVTPTRLLFDLAGSPSCHDKRVERMLDLALSRRLVSTASLTRVLRDLARRGRGGIRLMRQLIEARGADYRPVESGLEFRFRELAVRSGLTGLVPQVDVGDETGWIGRVDFIDPGLMLIVETDTALHHGSLTDRTHDDDRRTRLRAAGWTVESFTDIDVFHRPEKVVAALRSARQSARSSLLAG